MRTGWLRVLSIVALLGAWEWYGRRTNPLLFTYPSAIGLAGLQLALTGAFWKALGQSLSVLAWGLLLSVVVGVAAGLVIGRSRIAEALLQVPIDALYATPTVALVPVIVLWVGFGPVAKVVVVFLFSVFAIVINTARGVREVDPELVEVARSYLAREVGLWKDVVLPSALPYVVTGIRTNLAFHQKLFSHPDFSAGRYDTGFLERNKEALLGYATVAEEQRDAVAVAVAIAAARLERALGAKEADVAQRGSSLSPWVSQHRSRLR